MKEPTYVMMPPSMAHTFGNMTACVTEYVKAMFPPNYFKTVTIASTISYRHFNIFENTNREFIKKNKPMLIIRPRLDIMNEDTFLNGTLLTTRIADTFYDRDFGNLQPFVEDGKKGIGISYLLNRMKMYFDVSIILESQMEQFNQAVYLKNIIRQNIPFYLNTALESNVPRNIMECVAKDAGIDINDTKTFLDYLNTVSIYPVTYKLKNSTGNDEFFRFYPIQVDAMVSNLSIDDGSKKGFVDDAYAINYTLETEFSTAGLYFYFSREPDTIKQYAMNFGDIGMDKEGTINPSFTIVNLFNQEPPPGWQLYTAPLYKVESNAIPDQLEFGDILNSSLRETIKYQVSKGLEVKQAVNILIFKDNDQLSIDSGDYEIDWDKLVLTTKKVNTTSTYRMVIYVNTLYINNLVSDLLEFNQEK